MYKRLQEICGSKGTNITTLCKEVTGNSGNLATWKKGYMRSDYLSKAADILNCTTDYLLGRTENFQNVNQVNTGNIGDNAYVNVNKSYINERDEMTVELVKAFKSLSFSEKIEVINFVMAKVNKEENS